jgi:hypothetical protein
VLDPGTDWTAVLSAWAALGAVAIATVALVYQGHRTRLQLGISNMWSLIEKWDQPAMRRVRARTAAELLDRWESRQYLSGGGVDILNSFELVAYLVVRSKTLRLEDAWTNFSGWADRWWYVYLPAIESERADDQTLFEDYKQLVERFVEYEAKERGLSKETVVPTDADLRSFLEGEVELVERLRYREPLRILPKRLEGWLVSWRERRL